MEKFLIRYDLILRRFWISSDLVLCMFCISSDLVLRRFWISSDLVLRRLWISSDLVLYRSIGSGFVLEKIWIFSKSRTCPYILVNMAQSINRAKKISHPSNIYNKKFTLYNSLLPDNVIRG